MEKIKNSQIFSYVGAGLMLFALLFPFLKLSMAFFSQGLGLIFDMGKLGDVNGLMYLISILGIAVLGYCAYITFKIKDDYMKAAYAAFAYFVILFIMYFIVKSDISNYVGVAVGSSNRGLPSGFIKMGIGIFMPLLSGAAYFLADKAALKENQEDVA